MSDTLLLIGIGPVQDFIASARKLRDLFFGSHALSELSKTAARSLFENGATLIFPSITQGAELDEGSELNVSNKIMAKVASAEEADRLWKAAKSDWRKHLEKLAERTVEEIRKLKKFNLDEGLFRKQMADYGEFYAVWADIEMSGGYEKCRDRVERLLSSRKNLREFQAPSWNGAGIAKNSLDGMRESVIPQKAEEIIGLLKKNEKLDAMGCIKRFYPLSDNRLKKRHFYDLSDIALTPWLEGIEKDEEKRRVYFAFCDAIGTENTKRKTQRPISRTLEQPVCSDLFYAGRQELSVALVEDKNIDAAWAARKKLVGKCGEPNLYSVILVGDGDRMGKMIDAIESEEGHIRFTRETSRFAGKVRPVVEDFGGSLIYAGGDDVLAYLPLHTAVACADALRTEFFSIMEGICEKLNLSCDIPTFSVGLAIVHHACPLDRALDIARRAEKAAKTKGGRNSLAIVRSKRAGSDIEIVGKWEDRGDLPGIARRVESMVSLYNEPGRPLPSRLGYQLRQVRIRAGDDMEFSVRDGKLVPLNAAAAMVKRTFDHKNDGDPEKNRELLTLLSGRTGIREFSDELVVVNQIAGANAPASGKDNI